LRRHILRAAESLVADLRGAGTNTGAGTGADVDARDTSSHD
jgi:hypothetical protein